jgi:hypothetical protein
MLAAKVTFAIWIIIAGHPVPAYDAKPCVQHRLHTTPLCVPRRLPQT